MKRKWGFWVLMVIILFIGFRLVGGLSGKKLTIEKEKIVPVVVTSPTIGQIRDKLTLTGDIKGQTEVAVRPKTVGRVAEIYIKEGDFVQAGTPLMSYVSGISSKDELYEDLVTFAPISGVVGVQYVKIGEQVTSGPSGISPVFMIYQINRVKVYVDVPEKNFGEISRGMRAEIILDAYPDDKFSGLINNIRPVIDPLSRTTQVEIVISNPGAKIKPGMFCKVNLILKERNNVIIVPDDAVLGDGEKFVFLAVGDRAVKKTIQTGLKEENNLEVISGLSEKDLVISVGQRVVEDGSRIEVQPHD